MAQHSVYRKSLHWVIDTILKVHLFTSPVVIVNFVHGTTVGFTKSKQTYVDMFTEKMAH